MQWAYKTRKTTKADFLREISDMPGVPKLIAKYIGALTKDFSSPDSGIVRIPLRLAYTHPIYPASSTYKPLRSGSNSISERVNI